MRNDTGIDERMKSVARLGLWIALLCACAVALILTTYRYAPAPQRPLLLAGVFTGYFIALGVVISYSIWRSSRQRSVTGRSSFQPGPNAPGQPSRSTFKG